MSFYAVQDMQSGEIESQWFPNRLSAVEAMVEWNSPGVPEIVRVVEYLQWGKVNIRFSADLSVSMVWCGDEPLRAPTHDDMRTLPVGPDMSAEEVASLSD